MSRKKTITLSFDLEQVANDILAKCNLISENIRDAGMEDIRSMVQEPDGPETSSIINRSVTEAFGRVKVAAQRYLTVGRDADDNKLERMVSGSTYSKVQATYKGYPVYLYTVAGGSSDIDIYKTGSSPDTYKAVSDDSVVDVGADDTVTPKMVNGDVQSLTYETITLTLQIPNFNLSVTDHLKSSIHKYVVDYCMGRFLQDLVADKAQEYKNEAENEDLANIISDLNAREKYTMRRPSFM